MPSPDHGRAHLRIVEDTEPAPHDDTQQDTVEAVALGTAMESLVDLAALRDTISEDHFVNPRHGAIWRAICANADNGDPTNPVAVTEALLRTGALRGTDHHTYVFEVYRQAHAGQGGYWARILNDRHVRRNAWRQAAKLSDTTRNPDADLADIAGMAESVLQAVTAHTTDDHGPVHAADLAANYLDGYMTYADNTGITTPWRDVNDLMPTGGLERGQVVTFGGASGMGKSLALTDCVRHAGIVQQLPTVMFTLEMTAEQVFFRLLAGLTGIPERAIRQRNLDAGQLARVDQAHGRLREAPLWIVDGSRTMTQIANEVRKLRNRHGDIACVAVDYVQIVKPDRKAENRQLEVSNTMQRLKQFALDENVLVLAAAQINRSPNARLDKRPALSDLRESGEIENSSDVVVLIFREDYYDRESPRSGEVDLIVAKNRSGSLDTVTVAHQLHFTRFVDMAMG